MYERITSGGAPAGIADSLLGFATNNTSDGSSLPRTSVAEPTPSMRRPDMRTDSRIFAIPKRLHRLECAGPHRVTVDQPSGRCAGHRSDDVRQEILRWAGLTRKWSASRYDRRCDCLRDRDQSQLEQPERAQEHLHSLLHCQSPATNVILP